MMKIGRLLIVPFATLVFASTINDTPVAASSFSGAKMLGAVLAPEAASPVQWRRGWGGHRWWGPGPGVAILGGVIVGGALVAAAIAERRAEAAAMHRCAVEFRSFDPRGGTFIDRYGEVRVCPYLY
jgi:BA14K-like protein